MNTETLETMQSELLEVLSKDELLNKKGLAAIAKLVKYDESRALIRHAIKSSNSDKVQFVEGLKRLLSQYNTSAAINVRELCEQSATDAAPRRLLEGKIIPLLVELGIIVKVGERSAHWQAWDKIGAKPSLLDTVISRYAVTPEKQALRAAQDRATDEARLLTITKKQAAIANNRKATALQAVNASQEAERLAATLPKGNPGMMGWATQNPGIAISLVLAMVVVVGGKMTTNNTASNTANNAGSNAVQLAAVPATMMEARK